MSAIERIKKFFHFWYIQYIMHTGLYMLEEWERCLFTGVLVALVAMASYTTHLFLPGHLAMWARYLEPLLGHREDHASSTVETPPEQPVGT